MATIVDFVKMLSQAQWLSADELHEHRLPLLVRLLHHAEGKVPAWAEWLAPLRRADGNLDLSRWEEVPIMTRRHLEDELPAFTTTDIPPQAGPIGTIKTSGTTRVPLAIPMNKLLNLMAWAMTHRSHEWAGALPGGRLAAIGADAPGRAPGPHGHRGAGWSALDAAGVKGKLSIVEPMQVQHAWLEAFEGDYLKTYPSNLAALLRSSGGHAWPSRLRAIFTVGETLTDDQRATARAHTPAPITDVYATQEVGPIAIECRDCGRYHLCEETILVEIVDEAGRQQQPGLPGRVVVTGLNAYSTPIIRYDTGDYAVSIAGEAPCGRGHRSIERIMGRSRNAIAMPDGSRLWPRLHVDKLIRVLGFQEVQVVQHSLRDVEIRYVPIPGSDRLDAAAVQEHFRTYFYRDLETRLTALDTFPRSRGAKYEEIISLVA